jgi:hypothetical protein
VKCVVAQVPLVSGHANVRRLIRADHLAGVQGLFTADRRARMTGKPPAIIPVVVDQSTAPCALPGPDSWKWFTETGRTMAPSWKNEVTLRSVEMFTEYEPRRLRLLHQSDAAFDGGGARPVLTVPELAFAAYERALPPKQLVTLAGGHFDAYDREFETTSTPAVEWFARHSGRRSQHGKRDAEGQGVAAAFAATLVLALLLGRRIGQAGVPFALMESLTARRSLRHLRRHSRISTPIPLCFGAA